MSVDNFFSQAGGGKANTLNLTVGEWTLNGTAVEASAADLNSTTGTNGNALGSTASGQKFVMSIHTVTSGEATATTVTLPTGLTTISAAQVQIKRSNAVIAIDAVVTFSAGNLTVANGSTYHLTTSDIITYSVFGV